VIYLRKKLRCKETDSVFLYINSAFAPSLDEIVGNLQQVSIAPITWPTWCWITRWRRHSTDILSASKTPTVN
jgi:hypothetical protein